MRLGRYRWACLGVLLSFCFNSTGASAKKMEEEVSKATFAGGCFWCMEAPFEKLEGVESVVSGYTGGSKDNPTYKEVSAGSTGHLEAVQITYDPSKISYAKLLDVFWMNIDPTDAGGQFVDRGNQYRSVIFYHNQEQRMLAEKSKEALERSGRYQKPIVTDILEAGKFFKAEEYHQDYYKNNPLQYKFYRWGSGRGRYLEKIWKEEARPPEKNTACIKPSKEELRNKLTPLQYRVTQQNGTERAFNNEYWDNKRQGIYVDIVSGEALFSSTDKFVSGTGWPSFTKPLEVDNVVEEDDSSLFTRRTELRSKNADSHLGHVFKDGPAPTGLRYCINSAALRFIPKEELEEQGYGRYKNLFQD